jgi:hypothetical protein
VGGFGVTVLDHARTMLSTRAILRNVIIALALFAMSRCEPGTSRAGTHDEASANSAALQQTGHTY